MNILIKARFYDTAERKWREVGEVVKCSPERANELIGSELAQETDMAPKPEKKDKE